MENKTMMPTIKNKAPHSNSKESDHQRASRKKNLNHSSEWVATTHSAESPIKLPKDLAAVGV